MWEEVSSDSLMNNWFPVSRLLPKLYRYFQSIYNHGPQLLKAMLLVSPWSVCLLTWSMVWAEKGDSMIKPQILYLVHRSNES